ncbi:MAG TPA: GNAT family N-acetyltransferase [Nocardioides sp.]|nr:GNAT family N-acetyltransferase [Nocardioides sp.]
MVEVRRATYDDLPRVAAIYAPYVTGTVVTFELDVPRPAEWRQRLDAVAAAGLPFLVADGEDGVVGYAYLAPWKTRPAYRHTAEDSVYLDPAARGRGTGGLLLDALLEEARAAGVREVLAVIADNGTDVSPRLHRSRGFRDVGRLERVGRKLDRWVDTVLMQRSLVD